MTVQFRALLSCPYPKLRLRPAVDFVYSVSRVVETFAASRLQMRRPTCIRHLVTTACKPTKTVDNEKESTQQRICNMRILY
jgi:hypothetical protein